MENSTDSSSSSSPKSHDGTRMYNPYGEQFNGPAQYLYSLPTSPEIFSKRNGRAWNDNLVFTPVPLRTNRVLNSGGHTSRKFGNKVAIIGMYYAGFESMLESFRDTEDGWNTVGAGFGTGALYRAAGGPRSALIGGALGAFAAGFYVVGKQMFKKYVPLEQLSIETTLNG
ncbi:hypothetical protein MKW92_026757 [Papaver armeniacum]|nr:hypothetical protein MKW92_026757 [Papaver armeniacum]